MFWHCADHAIERKLAAATCFSPNGWVQVIAIIHTICGMCAIGSRVSHYCAKFIYDQRPCNNNKMICLYVHCHCCYTYHIRQRCISRQSNFSPKKTLNLKSFVNFNNACGGGDGVTIPVCFGWQTENDVQVHWYKRNVISLEAVSNMHRKLFPICRTRNNAQCFQRTNENVSH